MSRTRLLPQPPPVFQPRDMLRLLSLLMMSVFVLWAIWKGGNPRTWVWLTGKPVAHMEPVLLEEPPRFETEPSVLTLEQSNMGQAVGYFAVAPSPGTPPGSVVGRFLGARSVAHGYEHLPLPDLQTRDRNPSDRCTPAPSEPLLSRAVDREGFLVENPDGIRDPRSEGDADARYHLMQLAAGAHPDDFTADARAVRHSALVNTPQQYRGKIAHITGDLRRVTHFELNRDVPGLKHIYQGWITDGSISKLYCILFAELPEGFPPERDWNRMVQPVEFDGYFLKVLKADNPDKPGQPMFAPVLVGRTVLLPPVRESNLISIAAIVAIVFILCIIACGVAVWFYRKGDREVAERMARIRQRSLESVNPFETEVEGDSAPPKSTTTE